MKMREVDVIAISSFLRKRPKAIYYLKAALTRTPLQEKEVKYESLRSSPPSSSSASLVCAT
jgi:hypothetical protein